MAMSALVVSYVPLLRGIPGLLTEGKESIDRIQRHISEAPEVDACVWAGHQDEFHAYFLMEGAAEVAEHMLEWSEGEPENWFNVVHYPDGSGYHIGIFPKFDASIERFKIAYQLRTGFPIAQDTHYRLIFKPIYFQARSSEVYQQVEPILGDSIHIHLLETSEFDQNDVIGSISKSKPIGKIKLIKEKFGYFDTGY